MEEKESFRVGRCIKWKQLHCNQLEEEKELRSGLRSSTCFAVPYVGEAISRGTPLDCLLELKITGR